MSAVGGKADMTGCRCRLLRSLLGLKRTWVFAAHMAACDPKRTLGALNGCHLNRYDVPPEPRGQFDEAPRVYRSVKRRCNVAVRGACAAEDRPDNWPIRLHISRRVHARLGRIAHRPERIGLRRKSTRQ